MNRLDTLRARMTEEQLDALLIFQGPNCRYLSGFTGSNGFLLITATTQFLATDFRYYDQVGRQSPDWTLVKANGPLSSFFADLVFQHRLRRIGFEPNRMNVETHQGFEQALKPKGRRRAVLVPISRWVEQLRAVKSQEELARIERAIQLADDALAQVAARLAPGQTELQVAWELEKGMRERGAEGIAFEITVASGPNAALPHAKATERVIQPGEPIVIDMGARVEGYHSDLTRTFCLGGSDEQRRRFQMIYDIVLKAQTEAAKALRPGPPGVEIHNVAHKVIEDAGYGDYFGHGLGHGVGLEVHELPSLGRRTPDPTPLAPGMVVTLEPGIYLPDWGGVRIEDIALITADGCRILTRAAK